MSQDIPSTPRQAWAGAGSGHRIIHVVRHGHIPSYESDVALTAEGRQAAHDTGHQLAEAIDDGETVSFLHGPARRARETAWGIYRGLNESLSAADHAMVNVSVPAAHPGLRNLGMLVQGRLQEPVRPFYDAARAAYQADPSPENAGRLAFHQGFWDSDDPIGYWLTHPSSYAEDPEAVAARVREAIDQLLAEPVEAGVRLWRVICASHSAPMRAFLRQVLGSDPGEPEFCESFTVEKMGSRPARVVFREEAWRL